MNDYLTEVISRLAWLKWGAAASLVGGAFLIAFLVTKDLQGLPYRYWMRYCTYLERQLQRQFIWTPGSRIAVGQLVAMFVIFAAAVLIDLPMWYVFFGLAVFGPPLYIDYQRRKRVETIERQTDGFLVALSNALKATPSVADAFISVEPLLRPPLKEEVGLAIKEMRVGSTLDQAIALMANRIGSRVVDAALSAVLVGRQVGGNLPKILDTTSSSLREMARLDAVIRAKTAEAKAQIALLSVFPGVIIVAFGTVKRGYFDPLTQSASGYVVIVLAIGCWISSLLLARKIAAVER